MDTVGGYSEYLVVPEENLFPISNKVHFDIAETQGEKMRKEIILGDCIQGMRKLDEGTFNLIIADPPYNLNKDFGVWKETEQKAFHDIFA